MPLSSRYYTSFTGGSPYELGAVERQWQQEDEEDQHRRELEQMRQASRQRSYENSVKQMEQERAQRLGYGTTEQQIADPHSSLYQWSENPDSNIGFSMAPDARILGPDGPDQSELHAPPMRPAQHLGFMPRKRVVSPDAQQKISLLREATRSGGAMTPEEVAQRERIKADEAIRTATERDKLLAGRQNQAQQQQTLRTSANIQAGAPGSDRELIASNLESSSTATMAPQGPPPEVVAEPAAGGAAYIIPMGEQVPTLEEFAQRFRRRNMNATDEEILAEYRRRGGK